MEPADNTGCSLVVLAGLKEFTKNDEALLAIAGTAPGKPFIDYLGAAWSKSGDFPDAKAWESTVSGFAKCLKTPLVVMVK